VYAKETAISMHTPVIVSLRDLAAGNVDARLREAFGPGSLGLIVATGLDSRFIALRKRVLLSADRLAHLSEESLKKLEVPEAYWLIGWCCGKEKLANGNPDLRKGSFYINCNFYNVHAPRTDRCDDNLYGCNNVWPNIPGFEQDLKALVTLMINTARIVASACDRLIGDLPDGYLERMVATSDTTKARLLHYYAAAGSSDQDQT
jgi:hypothetical protein